MRKTFIWTIIISTVFFVSFMIGNHIGSQFEFEIQESAIKQNTSK